MKHLIAFILTAVSSFALATSKVEVQNPWVRLMPKDAPATGAFMTLKNTGDKDIKVLKAESSWAKNVELHDHVMENGIAKMRPVPSIDVKKSSETVLKPGSLHVMLIGLTKELKEKDLVEIKLTLDNGDVLSVQAPVKPMMMK